MFKGLRTLLVGGCALLLLSGCGYSAYSSSTGSGIGSGNGTSGTGGNGGNGDPIGSNPQPNGTNDLVVATPSVSGTVSVVVAGKQTVSITFTSSDGKQITGFGVSGTLGSLPAGWSGPASFACASVSTGSGCVLDLTYAPTAVATGTLAVNYVFVDNAGAPSTGGSLNIPYAATSNDNAVATVSPPGQINAVEPTGSQAVTVTFTTDDTRPATALQLTTSLATLPAGWSSTDTSFSCASFGRGSACQLPLTYAPTAYTGGTLTLNYSYVNNANVSKTGTVNIAYQATTNDNIVGTPGQSTLAVVTGTSTVDNITFTTDDGNPATNFSITSGLGTPPLPAGWSSTTGSLTCASVSTGTSCQLGLTYAPTAVAGGTLTFGYSYTDDSGTLKTGTASISYNAFPPTHLYVAELTGALYYCVLNSSDGTLTSCATTGSGFSAPTGIVFNGSYAYVTDYYDNLVWVCNAEIDGTLSSCTSTGSNFQYPWQLAVSGSTLYVTNAYYTAGVTTCAIQVDGTLAGCTESAGSGTAGVAADSSYAYIGAGQNTVDVCGIVAGALGACTATGSGFSSLDGIYLSGGYAYVANQGDGSVNVCTVNSDGTLTGCTESPVGGAPTSVVIQGSHAYVDDAYGNVYLCAVGTGGALTGCAISNGGTTFNYGIQNAIH